MFTFINPAELAQALGASEIDAYGLQVCKSVNSYLSSFEWLTENGKATEEAKLGALMLAARLHRRRNSPGGIETLGESGAAYVARTDPDLARLLKIDAYQMPYPA
ncbi:hypothetical protein QP568_02895 [Propionimicrobium lymphophilum]|uniref:hypothetical protein n=1 Tax=Propionimicrobium lymphophilum TaxID=33012 RepID=UPI00254CAC9D|nr:hypothetical protein [Propionimicrobium lymphophilum]MDK7709256.1 hypothetical protein [Propionimicrobium lymphophilum]MDK7733244.1 hypothetical protein [Propionimicrobium lymphophilum]